jgi:hypothetical protein
VPEAGLDAHLDRQAKGREFAGRIFCLLRRITRSSVPCIRRSGVEPFGACGSAVDNRPEKPTTAPTDQRPLAIASSDMIVPCEKPTKATRSSRPEKPFSAMIAETVLSKPGRAAAIRAGRFSVVTPTTLNHWRP